MNDWQVTTAKANLNTNKPLAIVVKFSKSKTEENITNIVCNKNLIFKDFNPQKILVLTWGVRLNYNEQSKEVILTVQRIQQ